MSKSYRHLTTGVVLPLLLGVAGFFDMTQRPSFRSFRAVDVFQLVVCGMCLGIGLTGFIEFLRRRRTD